MNCPACQASVPANAAYCPQCGTPLSPLPQAPKEAVWAADQHNYIDSHEGAATPTAVKFIVFLSVMLTPLGLFLSLQSLPYTPSSGSLAASFFAFLLFCWIYYALYLLRNWARIFFILWNGIQLLFSTFLLAVALCHFNGPDADLAKLVSFFFLAWLSYNILVIYYLTRPNIVAAYNRSELS